MGTQNTETLDDKNLKKRMLSEVSDNTLDARTEQEIHADTDKKFSQINTSNDNS